MQCKQTLELIRLFINGCITKPALISTRGLLVNTIMFTVNF